MNLKLGEFIDLYTEDLPVHPVFIIISERSKIAESSSRVLEN